ncbi:hypothetical protein TBLA_0D04090 [Henningerozyma blattae CBS 6284]|uniref:Uncharacterized protein n=1 Tax=Henningerozyma blattae (strain ATCC 34711 / CBS 6284 / DSM 70876 / NBRC 10599 / NRRL Y-10934 / UCD 77-7) TaxID=1071380 RepID=I2H3F4_HENB6|nr:hypothetical protein TBLA_0D04090 [Tetrapisispora blattae CBS 6284]CCH60906.1 hypothetical protein TBLA_0D04090 [Tetrapisispora blattae CBS 6284]
MFVRSSARSVSCVAPISKRFLSSGLTPVATKNAPPAAASYSQALKVNTQFNELLYVSGQIPFTPDNKPVEGSISDKAEQVFQNVENILKSGNSSLNEVVKVNVFLKDIDNFAEFNKVYAKYFTVHKPARSCVAVAALPLNVDLEMEVIAAVKKEN